VTWGSVLATENGAFRRGPFGSALKKDAFVASGYKVYEQYCAINDDCSFARYYITPEKFKSLESFAVKGGDFLISCSGVTLGRLTQVPNEFDEGVINQALLRVRLNTKVIRDAFFKILFRAPHFQDQIRANSLGTAIPNVKGVNDLKAIRLALPPIVEQDAIVLAVDQLVPEYVALERTLEAAASRGATLRSSILANAFTGNLVPSAPNADAIPMLAGTAL
jgi:type I restriction enzyme S subunit